MAPADARCQGCKSPVNSVFGRDCEIKDCAGQRALTCCSDCDQYPCQRLVAFRNDAHAHHSAVLSNLDRIRAKGLDAWLQEQRQRWSCSGCGHRFAWYEKLCSRCGGVLHNCLDEEPHLPPSPPQSR